MLMLRNVVCQRVGVFSHLSSSHYKACFRPMRHVAQRSSVNQCLDVRFIVSRLYKNLSQHFTNHRPFSFSSSPLLAMISGSLAVGLTACYRQYGLVVDCKDGASAKGRLARGDHVTRSEDQKEPPFPWREFFQLLLPDIWYLVGAVASALAVAFINIEIPLLLGSIVNVLAAYARNEIQDLPHELRSPALRLVYMYLLQGVLTTVYIALLSAVGERVAARMRRQLFDTIIVQDIAFFDANKTGEIINRLTTDVQDFKSSFKMCVSQGLKNIAQTLGCLVSLFVISPQLTIFMGGAVTGIIAIGSFMGSGLRKISRLAQAQVSRSTAVADEAIGNIRTVRAFAMEPMEIDLYAHEIELSSKLNQMLGIGIGAFQGLSNMALNGMVLGTLYVGGLLMSQDGINAGDLMSFLVATQTIQRSLGQLSLLFGQAIRGLSSGCRVFEYMMLQPSMPVSGGRVIPSIALTGKVEFRDVSFSYSTRPDHAVHRFLGYSSLTRGVCIETMYSVDLQTMVEAVLSDFNLVMEGGKMVALVGLSGGGKSTVAALLERFYDVESGSILLDGHDIQTLDPAWLRGHVIGFINQEPVLFATTVMENIRYGRPNATDEEVELAARLANAHDFIQSFPHGYKTVLGERGVTVSGGQKQRIAIARALIKSPKILILDEATSALDSESERAVQEALERVVKGRTVLVIAHRLSTVRDADVIAVINNGRIVEIGTHDELKSRSGAYWNLIRTQDQNGNGTTDNGVNPRTNSQG